MANRPARPGAEYVLAAELPEAEASADDPEPVGVVPSESVPVPVLVPVAFAMLEKKLEGNLQRTGVGKHTMQCQCQCQQQILHQSRWSRIGRQYTSAGKQRTLRSAPRYRPGDSC
jgi:hypothetical protein